MNPIHFDHAYAAQTEFGRPLVDSTFTLALVTGQSTIDLSFNVMANLGWDEVRLPNPLFEGDTVYSRSEVLDKRESKSRPNVGIVKVRTTGFKQDGLVVIEFLRTFMVYKRGHVPASARTRIPEPRKISRVQSHDSRSVTTTHRGTEGTEIEGLGSWCLCVSWSRSRVNHDS